MTHLLVLSRNDVWNAHLRSEAAALGLPVTMARSADEAIALLSANASGFSHFLLDPASANADLAVLLRLSAEVAAEMPLLVLRDTADLANALHHLVADVAIAGHQPGSLATALSVTRRARPRHLTVQALRKLLADSGVQLRYQPIVRLADRQPIGIEALARLEHPRLGMLPPGEFVPQLEAAGDGWALTEHVIATAFADWGDLRLDEFDLTMAINLPLDVLRDPSLPSLVAARCEAAGVPPTRLVLELTEDQFVVDPAALAAPMRALRALGIGLAIDDIAPLTHDLAALLKLPFSALKLDKDVVREAADCATTRAFICRSLNDGHAAGMEIVAEGVEDATLWAQMRHLGVDHAQGFHVARPLPAAAIPLWHHDWLTRRSA